MAAPTIPSSVTLGGDARALLVTWAADDTPEDYCEVAMSANNGSSYGDPFVMPSGDRQFVYHQPTAASTYKARVRRVYGVDASAWVESTGLAVTTVAAIVTDAVALEGDDGEIGYTSDLGTDVYLFVGENVDGQAVCLNPAALSDTSVLLTTRTLSVVGLTAIGASTITLDASTLTGFILAGDIITIAGDPVRYRCTTLTAAAANTLTAVPISPPLVTAAADNAVATVNSPIGFADVIPYISASRDSFVTSSVISAPKWSWMHRNTARFPPLVALPYDPTPVMIWNQIGTGVTISGVATSGGNTTITCAGAHSRSLNWGFWARIRNTGVTSLDNTIQYCVATSTTVFTITGHTASSTSSTGIIDLPFLDFYDETIRGHVDHVESGRQPSRYWGLERSFLALAQDAHGPIGDDSWKPIIALKVVGGFPIASRTVGSATTAKRWTRQREVTGTTANSGGSKFTDYVRQLSDMKTYLDRVGSAIAPGPYNIKGIVVGAGYNESASDIAQTRRQLNVVSVAVVGAVATITTATHSLTNTSGALYNIAIVSGLGGTLGTAINGKHYPLSVASTTTFDLLDFDATGLTGTVTSGTTVVDVGAPVYMFADLLSDHVDELRDAAIEELASSQDPEDIPVALMEPNRDIYWRYYQELLGSATTAITDIAFGQIVDSVRSVASAKEGCVSFSLTGIEHKNSTPALTSELYFGHDGQIEIGKAAWEAIQNPNRGSGTTKRPVIFGALIGDSYVVGTSAAAIGYLYNPEAISPETALASNRGEPITWAKVWNHATEAWETLLVDPTLDLAYGGRTNVNTNPLYNPGMSPYAGVHCGMFRELRLAFPDHDIYLLPFGINGATATSYVPSDVLSASIDGVTPGASTVTITLRASGTGSTRLVRSAPFNVVISGVSGLTPAINGSYVATPTSVSTTPGTPGTQTFTIPVASVTGTAVVTGALAAIPAVIWDPDASDVWDEFQIQVDKAIDAAHADGVLLDGRFGAVMLGTNDAAAGFFGVITEAGYTAAMTRIVDSLREAITTRALPRDEVPIVCLEPIVHGRNVLPSATIEGFQTALRAAIAEDTRAATLNVDETADRTLDLVTIAYDAIHPDTQGYFNLGVQIVRKLATITDWDAPLDLSGGGSGDAGIVEVIAS